MIRINDLILNENEIEYIMQFTKKELQVIFKNNNDIFVDATFEDIEWDYGNKKRPQKHTITKGVCDKNKKPLLTIEDIQLYIQELEEENEKLKEELNQLKSDYSLVVAECKKYKERNNDALEYVKYHREVNEENTIYETSKFDKYTNPKVLLNKLEGVKDGI